MAESIKSRPNPDLTARARIRDAALHRFASEGIAEAKLKDIAAEAGVSIPLITHHFGTKDGLRLACDEYLADVILQQKTEGLSAEPKDAITQLRETFSGGPLMAYFARTLADGSPHTAALIDRLVEDALAYSRLGVEQGVVNDHPRLEEFIKLLTLWQLGLFTMSPHVRRHLGLDMLDDASTDDLLKLSMLAGELLNSNLIKVDYAAIHRQMQEEKQLGQPKDAS